MTEAIDIESLRQFMEENPLHLGPTGVLEAIIEEVEEEQPQPPWVDEAREMLDRWSMHTVPDGWDIDHTTPEQAKYLLALWKAEEIPVEVRQFELEAFFTRWNIYQPEKVPTRTS